MTDSNKPIDEFTERRKDWSPCGLHDAFEKQIERNFQLGERRMERFEQKIDELLAGQSQQAIAIKELQAVITNGLSGEVRHTKACAERIDQKLTTVCIAYDAKFKEYEKFDWFRNWANRTREGMVTKVLSITVLGGFVVGMVIVLLWLAKHIGIIRIGTE